MFRQIWTIAGPALGFDATLVILLICELPFLGRGRSREELPRPFCCCGSTRRAVAEFGTAALLLVREARFSSALVGRVTRPR